MVRAFWGAAPILLLACGGPVTGDHGGDADADADSTRDTAAPLVPPGEVGARFTSAEVPACVDPGAREEARYDVQQAAHMEIDAAYLAGGGLVIADFTGDDILDVFISSEHDYQLWTGMSDGNWTSGELESFGGADMAMAVGGSAADVEGDGDLDLLVTRFDLPVMLFLNDGTGVFTDVSDISGLGERSEKWQSSSWADFDLDGDLDLVAGAYGPTPDDAFDTAQIPGDPKALYTNDGNGTFTDRSELLPEYVQESYTFMTAWYDINGDQYPELFFVNDFADYHPSSMLLNVGGTSFELVAATSFDCGNTFGMGAGIGDLNEDGLPDFLLTSFKELCISESLAVPAENAPGGIQWIDQVNAAGLTVDPAQQRYGWGAELFDADNDADLDAIIGYGLWSTYNSNPADQPDSLFLNDGDAGLSFTDVSATDAWDLDDRSITRGIAAVDLDKDGWLDIVKRDLKGPTLIRTARCGEEAWLELALEQPGTRNPDAIGATIRVTTHGPAGDQTQTRWIHSGSSSMYTGLPPEAHFGLDNAETVDLVEIVWPDGEVSRRAGLDTRQRYTVTRQD